MFSVALRPPLPKGDIGPSGPKIMPRVRRVRGSVFEGEALVVVGVDGDGVAFAEISVQDFGCQRVFDFLLDDALEGPGAEDGVEAAVAEFGFGGVGEGEGHAAGGQAGCEMGELDIDDPAEILLGEGVEDHDLIDAVEEFGAEVIAQEIADLGFDFPIGVFLPGEVLDGLRADVAGHDDDGVFEIDGAALAVGEAAVVEDLEEDVEDVAVGFFDFVEEDDGIRPAADGFGELAAFFVADVSWRGADEAGDGMLLHEFGHVDADEGVFGVKEEFREGFAELGFSDAGGAKEHEGADGAAWIAEAGAGAADGVGDGFDGFFLADDTAFEKRFHFLKAFAVPFEHFGDGNAGPFGDDLGNLLGGNFLADEGGFRFELGVEGFLAFGKLLFEIADGAIAEPRGFFELAFAGGFFKRVLSVFNLFTDLLDGAERAGFLFPLGGESGILLLKIGKLALGFFELLFGGFVLFFFESGAFDFKLHYTTADFIKFLRHGIIFDAELAGGFIHEVDGLVGEEAFGDVTVAQGGGGDDRGILDADAVVGFVAVFEAAQDGDGVFDAGFADEDLLEAAFEGGVFFDVFAELIEGGGTDAAEFAAGEHGFEEVAGVHGAFGPSLRLDDVVDFIDEEE